MNLIDLLDRGACLDAQRPCFLQEGRTFTYGDVRDLTFRIGSALRAEGFCPGDVGAVLSHNDATAFTCALSLVRAGGIWVPINPRSVAEEIAYFLDFTGVQTLFYGSAFEDLVTSLRKRCPGIRSFVCIDAIGTNGVGLSDWIKPFDARAFFVPYDAADTVAIGATGGTTGQSKGVMLSHRNIATFVANVLACMPFESPPVYLAAAPLTHAAGIMVLAFMALGGTTVVLEKPDPQTIMKSVSEHQIDTLLLPPTMIYMLLSQPNVRSFDYSSLKYFIYAAAPMSTEKLREAIEVFGPVMTQMYGQAEAPMTITFMGPKEHRPLDFPSRLRSCGRVSPFVRVAVMDDEGRLLGDDMVGEIVVQGDLVMKGYLDNPDATAQVSRFGWHHTGDIGYRDAQGFYYIIDRKKDLIITGGFNVFPSEIEQVIASHPAVHECAVIGVPDDKWGEAVKAVVQTRPGRTVSQEELIALCKSRLGSVKAPKSIDFVSELPHSPVGKILKRKVRDTYWSGHDRMVG
ncbi:AMP-binding protein [Castellaniella sp. GW247-6E4]|uniref:AMP-binding protein n=1 Tax=Castellaniella sp. GW247-6E4 TaxID=3140380 RepID=UPI0033150CC6